MEIDLLFDGGGHQDTVAYGSWRIITSGGDNRIERVEFGIGFTNNEAEYMTLIAALEKVLAALDKKGIAPFDVSLTISGDSMLVKEQIGTYTLVEIPWSNADTPEYGYDWNAAWKTKEAHLVPLRDKARQLLERFYKFDYQHIPRKDVVKVLGH